MKKLFISKKRIGLTQKLLKNPKYKEDLCCLDLNWFNYLSNFDVIPIPLPILNDDEINDYLNNLELDGFILTGGNTINQYIKNNVEQKLLSAKRDFFEKNIIKFANNNNVPILGICRGLQLINIFYGGKLKIVKDHTNTSHSIISSKISSYIFPKNVNSYHDFAIDQSLLGKNLVPLCFDIHGNIEALSHKFYKVIGLMWHPEREIPPSKTNIKIFKDFFQL